MMTSLFTGARPYMPLPAATAVMRRVTARLRMRRKRRRGRRKMLVVLLMAVMTVTAATVALVRLFGSLAMWITTAVHSLRTSPCMGFLMAVVSTV